MRKKSEMQYFFEKILWLDFKSHKTFFQKTPCGLDIISHLFLPHTFASFFYFLLFLVQKSFLKNIFFNALALKSCLSEKRVKHFAVAEGNAWWVDLEGKGSGMVPWLQTHRGNIVWGVQAAARQNTTARVARSGAALRWDCARRDRPRRPTEAMAGRLGLAAFGYRSYKMGGWEKKRLEGGGAKGLCPLQGSYLT